MPKLIPELPSEIISDILSRLPVKCLIRFKCVSKTWRSLISDPEFARMHLKRTKDDTDVNHHKIFLSTSPLLCIVDPEGYCDDGDGNLLTTQLHFPTAYPEYNYIFTLGTCDGLVCGLLESDKLIYIWNPSTRESRELLAFPNPLDPYNSFYGFGYDLQLDDYKIITGSMSTSTNSDGSKIETKVQVFTLKSNMWRTVQHLCCSVLLESAGTLANGVLHWLVTQHNGPTVMVSFDLVEEKFQEMVPLRGLTGDAIYWHYELGVLGDWLCLYSDYGLSCDCEAWIMKEYSSEASWTSFLRFNGEPNPGGKYWFRLLWMTKNGNIVFDLDGRALVFYNPKEETSREFSIDHHDADWFEPTVYIESLVSPDMNGGFNGLNI